MVSKLAKNIAHFFVVQKIVEKPKEAIYTYGKVPPFPISFVYCE